MPLRVIARAGADDIAVVYLAEIDGRPIECVESTQPTLSREEKWVLMVSTLYGCPVGCAMCDAGGDYRGRIPAEGILAQIDHLVLSRYPD
ncbi:MAG TPA: radical SAM protein, partial [Thermoplasmata archaeon]|nr:radical SAM protein [Thermoplasmata archaeon]